MHNIRFIRENPEAFDLGLLRRGLEAVSKPILELDSENRSITTTIQKLQTRRNTLSKEVGKLNATGGDAAELISEVGFLKAQMEDLEENQKVIGEQIFSILDGLPNLPAEEVPEGKDDSDNIEVRRVGEKPFFEFEPKDHVDLGGGLNLIDFSAGSRLSGSRFVVTTGLVARLERALAAMMLDMHTLEFGYCEVNPPLLVNDEAARGTGQLPKFKEDLFKTTSGHWLIPTAEVPLTNLVADRILDEDNLPYRVTAYTPCFRSEAGAAGQDTRGMLRQHQFHKVELVSVTRPEESEAEHDRMTACAEEVLKRLGLHYRVVLLATGDLGFSARKTYDIEVWLPGQNRYREISSCSNCGDFQARRMKARYRPEGNKGSEFVHTLNGSGLAVGRTLIAILENYQKNDGSILIPEVLVNYMGGIRNIEAVKVQ